MQKHFRIPPVSRGMKVGLYGGSFNPPHQGHIHVSRLAIKKLALDQIWWLVTPGNPLKSGNNLLPLEERLQLCSQLTTHSAIRITALEATHRLRYTADTVKFLTARHPQVNFIWIMGADNLANFHKWDRWRDIADTLPLAIIDRPNSNTSPNSTAATHALSAYRKDERDSTVLALMKPPAWTLIHGKRSYLSSTQIRNGANQI